jgi:hypothetical protein
MQGFRLNTFLGMLLVQLGWGREIPHFPTPLFTRVRGFLVFHAIPRHAQPAGVVPQHPLFPFGHPALDENGVRVVLSGQ